MILLIVCAAPFVCKVEKTKWPVSAAVTAVEIVSVPLISPIRATFTSSLNILLIAVGKSIDEINKYLGSTSLNYLSYNGLIKATRLDEFSFSTPCFTGEYPIDIKERKDEVSFL